MRGTSWADHDGDEVPLEGGKTTDQVIRVGATVRRSSGPSSPFMAQLLEHLRTVQYSAAPRCLGTDERGRDVLSFIDGEVSRHPAERREEAYAMGGRLLRDLHDATAGHRLAADSECVLHGDPGPFNTIFRDGMPVAFIDWDGARPGPRLEDLGYMAWTWCVSAEVPIDHQCRRLRSLRDGYGMGAPKEVVEAMISRQQYHASMAAAQLERGDSSGKQIQHARMIVAWAEADRKWIEQNAGVLLNALR